jgi:hypothetical protein
MTVLLFQKSERAYPNASGTAKALGVTTIDRLERHGNCFRTPNKGLRTTLELKDGIIVDLLDVLEWRNQARCCRIALKFEQFTSFERKKFFGLFPRQLLFCLQSELSSSFKTNFTARQRDLQVRSCVY